VCSVWIQCCLIWQSVVWLFIAALRRFRVDWGLETLSNRGLVEVGGCACARGASFSLK
jgi:hypothetical protein